MITGYANMIAYFKGLAESNKLLQDFVVGGSERILMRENAINDYPIMWLTFPDISGAPGGEDLRLQYNLRIFLLDNTRVDDWEEENAALDATLVIATQLISRLNYDAEENNLFEFDPSKFVLSPKPKWGGDNDHGWVLDCDIKLHGSLCYNPDEWQ